MKKFILGLLIGVLITVGISVGAQTVKQYTAKQVSYPIIVNGEELKTDKPIVSINGSTYMPLAAIGEVLNIKVAWNSTLKRVEVGETAVSSVKTSGQEDYSDWVQFKTDDYSLVQDGALKGDVVYCGDETYLVSPEYYSTVIEPLLEKLKSLEKEGSNIINSNSNVLTPDDEFAVIDNEEDKVSDAELQAKNNALLKYGFASSEDMDTEIGKAYIKFCTTWVSERELKNSYGISTVWDWPDREIHLIWDVDKKYIIKGTPNKFVSGNVYTDNNLEYQYLEKFEYNGKSYNQNQYYFNREDLISKGIIQP